jgi:diketogulonate reductase-like aldo/keto reductase
VPKNPRKKQVRKKSNLAVGPILLGYASTPGIIIIFILRSTKKEIASSNSQIYNFLSLDTHACRPSYNTKLLSYNLNKYINIFYCLYK